MVAQSISCFLPLVADHCVASAWEIFTCMKFDEMTRYVLCIHIVLLSDHLPTPLSQHLGSLANSYSTIAKTRQAFRGLPVQSSVQISNS